MLFHCICGRPCRRWGYFPARCRTRFFFHACRGGQGRKRDQRVVRFEAFWVEDVPCFKIAYRFACAERVGRIFCRWEIFRKDEHFGENLMLVSTSHNFTMGTGKVNESREKDSVCLWKQDKGSDTTAAVQGHKSLWCRELRSKNVMSTEIRVVSHYNLMAKVRDFLRITNDSRHRIFSWKNHKLPGAHTIIGEAWS